MDFFGAITQYKKTINKHLKKFFTLKTQEAQRIDRKTKYVVNALAEFTLRKGAKRIRPILVLLAYKLCGGRRVASVYHLAVAVELFHSYLLIHDDIIDRDTMRRGKPTLHRVFEKGSGERNLYNAQHNGVALAIIAGDLAHSFALECITRGSFTPAVKQQLSYIAHTGIIKTIYGEILDVLGADTPQQAMRTAELKTAYYTFVNPLLLGAVAAITSSDEPLSGASSRVSVPEGSSAEACSAASCRVFAKEDKHHALTCYGTYAGLAFQLHDDMIGLFGERKTTGKDLGSDIVEKKNTTLLFEARKRAQKDQKAEIKRIWLKKTRTQNDIARIKKIIISTGSYDYVQQQKCSYKLKAQQALHPFPQSRYKILLNELAEYIITRNH